MIKFPKSPRQQNRALLDMARGKPCLLQIVRCADTDTTVAAHSNWSEHGKGMGKKAHDQFTVWSCSRCHDAIDGSLRLSSEEKRRAWGRGHFRQMTEWNKIVNQVNGQESNRDIEAAAWALGQLG